MKNLFTALLMVSFGFSFAQQESFLTRHFFNSEVYEYADLSAYSVFQSQAKTNLNLIPKNANDQTITLGEQSFLPITQGVTPPSNVIGLSPYLGTSTTKTFELLNQKGRTTYIFDAQGNLRSSQMSISIGKKKN
ncbi:MAG: hypothetical protein RLN88_14075 [Ekhidna sp.]|uniref:hypothetical protein n=1 Tax=Ekhidna sp. TaxID=2608089 RepID=UPI0032ECFFFA